MKRLLDRIFKTESRCDALLIIITVILVAYGSIMVCSAGYAYAEVRYADAWYFAKRQAIWLIIGIAAMWIGSQINIEALRKATPLLYAATMLLLVLTLIIGFVGNGAQRWISIGPITIQPSEIAKLTMVLMLALYFDVNKTRALATKGRDSFIYGTLFPVLIMLIPIVLVMLQKHLSCIIILGLIGLSLILIAGINMKYILGFIGAGGVGVTCLALFTDYTKDRITVWLDPEAYKLTGGWQTLQGLMAIGSGGLFGKGLGQGELKYCYVSEPANDMIFAILCEELGVVGALAALGLFCAFVWRGFSIALKTSDTYSRLVCLGISIKIAIQTLLNVAVVTNTIPNTGISLPFFSYGGSSLIMILFEVGIMLSISRRAQMSK